ncbi:MAG: hypothetical protein ACYDG2_17725 [Ruminiclostridium sp.]
MGNPDNPLAGADIMLTGFEEISPEELLSKFENGQLEYASKF